MKYTLGLIHLSCLRSVVAWQSIPSLVCDSGRIRHSGPAWDSCETKTYFATCLPSLKKSSARFGIIDSYDYLGEVQKPNRPPLRRPIRPTSSAGLDRSDDDQHQRGKTGDAPIGLTPHEQAMQDPTLLSSTNVTQAIKSPYLLRYLRETGILQLTRVQQETYGVIRQGKSLVARSKTGSGKTLAFLLPILDDLLEKRSTRPQAECSQLPLLPRSDEAQVLILVPTRELGLQILEQIQDLLKHRPDALTVMNLSGGTTSLGTDRCFLAQLKRTPDLLVATPGRLVDLITERPGSSPTRIGRRKFCDVLGNIRTLVLDEADRILLEGFKKETIRILSVLPRTEKRQTLLFSATIPEKMNEQLESILPNNFTRVDCIEEANICDRVTRAYWKIPSMECYTASLIAVILREIELDPHRYKVLVFFPTAKLVRFYANLYKEALDNTVLEIHSRMSQSSRNKARLSFTRATKGILFTSDVTARGKFIMRFTNRAVLSWPTYRLPRFYG